MAHRLLCLGGMNRRLPTVTLEELLSKRGRRLPLLEALYVGLELAKRVEGRHRMGLGVGELDVDRVLIDEEGAVSLGSGARGPHDVKKDVFALGRVLYELLTGASVAEVLAVHVRSPGARVPAPSRFNPAIDSELDTLVAATVSSDESLRPASVRVLIVAIEAAFEELELPVVPGGVLDDVARALPSASSTTQSELPLSEVVVAILAGNGPPPGTYATPAPLPTVAIPTAVTPPRTAVLRDAVVVPTVLARPAPTPAPILVPPPPPAVTAREVVATPEVSRPGPVLEPRVTRRPPAWWSEPREDVITEQLEPEAFFDEEEARPPESSAAWTLVAAVFSVVAIGWTLVLPM